MSCGGTHAYEAGTCLPPGGNRGAIRLLLAFSELVPIMCGDALKLQCQLSRGWSTTQPQAVDEYVTLARTRIKDLEEDASRGDAAERSAQVTISHVSAPS